jgi:hypothetical protein
VGGAEQPDAGGQPAVQNQKIIRRHGKAQPGPQQGRVPFSPGPAPIGERNAESGADIRKFKEIHLKHLNAYFGYCNIDEWSI